MKTLDLKIRKGGFDYIQQKRNKNTAMYYQYNKDGILAGIEIFKIKTVGDKEVFGNLVLAHECYPSDSDMGLTCWSVGINKERADSKYRELAARVKKEKEHLQNSI